MPLPPLRCGRERVFLIPRQYTQKAEAVIEFRGMRSEHDTPCGARAIIFLPAGLTIHRPQSILGRSGQPA